MAPVLRPGDRPFAPGAPPMGAPGPMGDPPAGGPPMGPPGMGGPPMPDPAEIQRQSMLALLEQAQPVPDTVQRYPGDLDTSPHPYFPAESETRRGRRDPY